MKKALAVSVVVGLLVGLVGFSSAQSIQVAPKKITTTSYKRSNAQTAYIGVMVTNKTTGITVSTSDNWIVVSPSSFDLLYTNGVTATNLSVSLNTASKDIGNYAGTITIVGGGITNVIDVSVMITEPREWSMKYPFVMFDTTPSEANPKLVEPKEAGNILIFSVSNIVYISKGLTTNDWIKLAP
jgi:hypothetical protein